MTPHLRRLATAMAILLALVGLAAFAVGRATRPTDREVVASRLVAQREAFAAAEHASFDRARARGHAAGVDRGRSAGRRAGRAQATAIQVRTRAAAHVQPPVQVASSASGGSTGEAGCCSGASQSPQKVAYASQPQSTGGDSSSGDGSGSAASQSPVNAYDRGASSAATTAATAGGQSAATKSQPGSAPAAATSSGVTYRERRSWRYRTQWSTSQSGTTTYRYSAKTSYRATTTSGGTTTTRTASSRTVYWRTTSSG